MESGNMRGSQSSQRQEDEQVLVKQTRKMASMQGMQALPSFEGHANTQSSDHQTSHSTDRNKHISKAERGWQKTVYLQEGLPHVGCLAITTSI